MRIVIAAEIFLPDIGGPATYSQKLAEELILCDYEVSLICYSGKKHDGDFGFKIKRVLRGQNTFFRYFKYFWHLFRLSFGTDVIYAQGPVCSGLPALLVSKILRKRLVVKVVGDYAWEQARNLGKTELSINDFQKNKSGGKIKWLKKIEKFVCKKADKVIVPSEYLKKIVIGWEIKEVKIEVINNAAEVITFMPAQPTLSKSPRNCIISVGRLVSWKGFSTLIELMAELLNQIPNLKLEIYGDGPDREKLHKLITDLDLGREISIDKIDHRNLLLKLIKAEIFILNSAYEGLPHTVLEAMSVGTPVITTNVGGNPELIIDGENGLLVEYNNKEQLKEAILKLYNNPELRQKFVKNSYEVLKKFSFEEMINRTIKILNFSPKR